MTSANTVAFTPLSGNEARILWQVPPTTQFVGGMAFQNEAFSGRAADLTPEEHCLNRFHRECLPKGYRFTYPQKIRK